MLKASAAKKALKAWALPPTVQQLDNIYNFNGRCNCIYIYISLNMTPNIDCYRVRAVPNSKCDIPYTSSASRHHEHWPPTRNQGLGFRVLPRPPNYPLTYPKYPLLRAIRAPLKGPWGVLVKPNPLNYRDLHLTPAARMCKMLRL